MPQIALIHPNGMEMLKESLDANRERLAVMLGLPLNLGIQLHLQTGVAGRKGFLLWVEHLASEEALGMADGLLRNCLAGGAPVRAQGVPQPLRAESTNSLDRLAEHVLAGWVAVVTDESAEAVLLAHPGPLTPLFESGRHPYQKTIFSRELPQNLALIRRRLRSVKLRAVQVPTCRSELGGVALVYLHDRASPSVVRAVRRWVAKHAEEGTIATGALKGTAATLGLLPRFDATPFVDLAVHALDAGYVLLLADGVESVYLAPVTESLFLTSASDTRLSLPIRRWLQRFRILCLLSVLFLPGVVVSLLNYHQEMIPTAFLPALGSVRETAPFATLFEVLLVEGMTEVSRETSFRLPLAIPMGFSLVVFVLITLLAVMVGFVGPLPALAGVAGALLSLTLPSNAGAYLIRTWRFYLLLGANTLGFFGMATVFAFLLTYLSQARWWGVAFFGPTGLDLASGEGWSSRPPRMKGGNGAGQKAKGRAAIR